jgi:hypothetical protein
MADFAMADLGYASLLLSFFLALYAAGAAFIAARRNQLPLFASARNAALAVAALTTLAVGILEWALITHQFRFEYVALQTSIAQPLLYNTLSMGSRNHKRRLKRESVETKTDKRRLSKKTPKNGTRMLQEQNP